MKPGEHITVTVASRERGSPKVYTGFLKSLTHDLEYGDLQLEIALTHTTTVQTEKVPREEVRMNYNATLIRDKESKRVKIYLEVAGQPDHYIVRGNETEPVERKMGEEMPLYASMPEEILLPILEAARCSELYDHPRQCFHQSPVARVN